MYISGWEGDTVSYLSQIEGLLDKFRDERESGNVREFASEESALLVANVHESYARHTSLAIDKMLASS